MKAEDARKDTTALLPVTIASGPGHDTGMPRNCWVRLPRALLLVSAVNPHDVEILVPIDSLLAALPAPAPADKTDYGWCPRCEQRLEWRSPALEDCE
jgi:hypothetical protein